MPSQGRYRPKGVLPQRCSAHFLTHFWRKFDGFLTLFGRSYFPNKTRPILTHFWRISDAFLTHAGYCRRLFRKHLLDDTDKELREGGLSGPRTEIPSCVPSFSFGNREWGGVPGRGFSNSWSWCLFFAWWKSVIAREFFLKKDTSLAIATSGLRTNLLFGNPLPKTPPFDFPDSWGKFHRKIPPLSPCAPSNNQSTSGVAFPFPSACLPSDHFFLIFPRELCRCYMKSWTIQKANCKTLKPRNYKNPI